ncbi:MAG: DUF1501 domain-containing protein [Candidatus Hydrogenedentes bacterium]|nr:DUF1501 domain-containing protein [Candidatus Hydrogenedentota bacterium]
MVLKCSKGCDEYRALSRRQFLGAGAAAMAMAAGSAWLPRVAYAQDDVAGRDIIVSLFLRGGCDGLSVIAPFGDAGYYAARPNLAIAPPDAGAGGALDLDGFFGFAPAMGPLMESYGAGNLLLVHACGMNDGTRSHFDAMHFMEVGKARDPLLATGWLGRHLMHTAPPGADPVLRAVGMAPALQRTLAGSPLALPVPDPAAFRLPGDENSADARLAAMMTMYGGTAEPLRTSAAKTSETIALLERLNIDAYAPGGGAVYPESEIGLALRSSAALIRGEVGVEAIAVDLGGWDTHEEQGAIDGGMAALMAGLAEALAAFHADIIAGSEHQVTLVVMSEFGRMVDENLSKGTDHGHGGIMMVLGGAVQGGRVLADWPGLAVEQRFEGQDLAVTIEYRDILYEIAERRLATAVPALVFPDLVHTRHGVFGA